MAIYNDIVVNRMPHSVLLVSPDNYNLMQNAIYIAKSLMCLEQDKPCGTCVECKKIEHQNSVDVQIFPKSKQVLDRDEVNNLLDLTTQAPYESDKKIFVIKDFDSASAVIQNKLLKTLEEPVLNTYFILLANDENNILQTIKSRCRQIFLNPICQEEIVAELEKIGANADTKRLILSNLGMNNVSLALRYAQVDNLAEIVDLVQNILIDFNKSSQMLEYSTQLYKMNDVFDLFLTLFLHKLSQVVDELLAEGSIDDKIISQIAQKYSIDAVVALIKQTNEFVEKRRRNCNFNSLVDSFLFMILEVRRKWPIE